MIRNFKDVEIYWVAKNCGDAKNHKVAENFESISSHEKNSNDSYSDTNPSMNNQEILSPTGYVIRWDGKSY